MTVPARSPADDALDRLLAIVEAAEKEGRWHLSGRDVINMTQAAMTVREALERQRELAKHESDEIDHWREQFEAMSFERDAAEAEVRQLREREQNLRGELRRSDLRVRRLTEGLRDLIKEAPEALDQNAVWVDDLLDLLSASPSDGGGAK